MYYIKILLIIINFGLFGIGSFLCFIVAVTHGVLSGPAIERLQNSKLKELVITDSIAPTKLILDASNIRIINLAPLIAEAIRRISSDSSVSSLFD